MEFELELELALERVLEVVGLVVILSTEIVVKFVVVIEVGEIFEVVAGFVVEVRLVVRFIVGPEDELLEVVKLE